MSESLDERLTEFNIHLDCLPESEEPPPTTLQILGRSKLEQDWQRLLFHFLSPAEGHGLNHALLEYLLAALSDRDDLEFEFSRFDLDNIRIKKEVVTSGGGRPDAVMWSGEDWFICWELKVTASEGDDQTRSYVAAESFQSIGLGKHEVPEDGHYYIYLAPDSSSPPDADEFVPVSWEWVGSQLQSFLSEGYGRYPAQTTAQLNEFTSTIESELTMTEYRENQQEKASLYFEYYDEIGEAREAFENQWNEFANNWGTRLAPIIERATITEISALSDSHVAIELENSDRDRNRWMFRQGDPDWGGIVKDRWWRKKDDLSPIYNPMDGKQDVRISFYHRLEQNRNRAIRDRTLEFQLWHGTGNGDEFMYSYRDNLSEKINEERDAVPSTVELTGKRGNPLIATYDIPVGEHDDFFQAYLAALRDGFQDLAVERDRLIELIDQSFEECLDSFS